MLNEIDLKISDLIDTIRLKEKEERKRYYAAIDIEDMGQAQLVTLDARAKFQQLKKWADSIGEIKKDITSCSLFAVDLKTEEVTSILNAEPIISPIGETNIKPIEELITTVSKEDPEKDLQINEKGIDEPKKEETSSVITETKSVEDTPYTGTGEYVRQKLYELSNSGFIFTTEEINNLLDQEWSKSVLNIPHAFARIYDPNRDIFEQTSIGGIPWRYWGKDRFKFGEFTLLIYSDWNETYLPYFISWYNTLAINYEESSSKQIDDNLEVNNVIAKNIEESNDNEIKVSQYIREKLRELSKTNYEPTEDELRLWQDKIWSKKVLNLFFPFAKIHRENQPMSEQIKGKSGNIRYWSEIFELGKAKILFCNNWYCDDRAYFDGWYDSLDFKIVDSDDIEKHIDDSKINESSELEQIDNNEESISQNSLNTSETIYLELPKTVSLLGKVYPVQNWDDVVLKICESMILKKPYATLEIGLNKPIKLNDKQILYYSDRSESADCYKLSNGLALLKNLTKEESIHCCMSLIELCGLDTSHFDVS